MTVNKKVVQLNYYKRNTEKYRSRAREYRHGITPEQYQKLFEEQKGNCALCGNPESVLVKRTGELLPLSIDHDHSCCPYGKNRRNCGKCVRGLICSHCNKGLGYFKDSITNLEKAIEYLKRTKINDNTKRNA